MICSDNSPKKPIKSDLNFDGESDQGSSDTDDSSSDD